MPTEPWFWIVIAVLVMIVVVLAILKGNIGIDLTKEALKFSTSDRRDAKLAAAETSKVTVAKNAEVSGRVDRITGEVLRESDARAGETSVADSAKISGRVGEIIGRASTSSKQ